MLDTWLHLKDHETYAEKIYEGLTSGGRLVVADYAADAEMGPPQGMRIQPEKMAEQMQAAGLRVEIMSETMPRHFMLVGFKD